LQSGRATDGRQAIGRSVATRHGRHNPYGSAFDDLHIAVALPATTNTLGGPTVFNPDLAGTIIAVDNGQMIQGLSTTVFDFSKTPIMATAPSPSLTTLNASTYTIGHQEYLAFDWTVPFTAVGTLNTLGIPANITIGMNLGFGVIDIPIPEPGTLLLLGRVSQVSLPHGAAGE
jgi:hypothetical protein